MKILLASFTSFFKTVFPNRSVLVVFFVVMIIFSPSYLSGKEKHLHSHKSLGGHSHSHECKHGKNVHSPEFQNKTKISIEDEINHAKCEHDILKINCDECRYELGVVKVSSEAMKLIQIEKPSFVQVESIVELTGELTYDENRIRCITTRFPGRIASISARIGDLVKEGSPLISVESMELAQTALEFLKKKFEADFMRRKLDRETFLHQRKISSELEVQEAQAAYDLAKIELENAYRKIAMFGIPLERIDRLARNKTDPLTQGKFDIYSPISGRVIARDGNIGDVVSGEKEILKIADLSTLWGIVHVPDKHIGDLLRGLAENKIKSEIMVNAFPTMVFTANEFTPAPQINVETRTLPLRLSVRNPNELLKPGMFFQTKIYLGGSSTKLSVPKSAVVEDSGQQFVFKRFRDVFFIRQDVQVGSSNENILTINNGLTPEDEVITNGAFLLKSDILRTKMGAGCAD